MLRRNFIKLAGMSLSISTLSSFSKFAENFVNLDYRMPVLFVGHGSPMNAIEDNEFSQKWKKIGQELPKPKAIVCVSAHWLTNGTYVTSGQQLKTIHDFYGFPQKLYSKDYPAKGNPELAFQMCTEITREIIKPDFQYGLDHGTWSILCQMYPNADIPVIQLSLDINKNESAHYELARNFKSLRDKGVLIIASGNIVHNLEKISWENLQNEYAYEWAQETDSKVIQMIRNNNLDALIKYPYLSFEAKLSIPTNDHFLPLLYAVAMKDEEEKIDFFNQKIIAGSLSMTSVKIGG